MPEQQTECPNWRRWFYEFLVEPLRTASDEQREQLNKDHGRGSWRVVVVLLVSAFALIMRANEYQYSFQALLGHLRQLATSYPSVFGRPAELILAEDNAKIVHLIYWAFWQSLGYILLPVLTIKLVFRQRLSDFGLKFRGMWKGWWIYLAMYVVILPAVLICSTTESFQKTYPFLSPPPAIDTAYWTRFWIWQGCYALQFISLEFFFRGFMIHGTRRWLGPYSILVMMIPYCMIHFGKPLPETFGAIIAGTVLGFMSLKTRSVWLGGFLHISVAITMDLASISQQ